MSKIRNYFYKSILTFGLCCMYLAGFGQTITYTNTDGDMVVEAKVLNPCDGILNNGHIIFTVISSQANEAVLINVAPGNGATGVSAQFSVVPVGGSFDYNSFGSGLDIASNTYIMDAFGTGGSGDKIEDRMIDLNDISTPISITTDLVTNNSSCVAPDGSIEVTVSGGSGNLTYSWTGPGGYTNNIEDIGTGLDPPIVGGTYDLTVSDEFSDCFAQMSFMVGDPVPNLFNINAPFSVTVCDSNDLTVVLDGSDVGVSYEILLDGLPLIPQVIETGTGGVLNFIVPGSSFTVDGQIISIEGKSGFCTPVSMNNTITVDVDSNPDNTLAVSAVSDPICQNTATSIEVAGSESGFVYQLRNDAGDINIGGGVIGNGAAINLPTGSLSITTTFNILVSNGVCTPIELTNLVTVNVTPASDAGMDNNVDACNLDTNFDLFASLLGSPDAGGTWADLDASGGVITGDLVDLTATVVGVYRFEYTVVGTAPCPDPTAIVTLNVTKAPDAGIDNSGTVCSSETNFDLIGNLLGTPDVGGIWTDIDGSGGTITGDNIDLSVVTNGVYDFLYTITGVAPCTDAMATLTLTVEKAADAGTDNTVDACNSEAAFDLIGSLGGTADAGGAWTDVDGSGGTITGDNIDLTSVMAGTFNFLYNVTGTAPCTDASATLTINVVQSANAGSDNAVTACTSETSFDLFGNLLGTPDAGGAWADLDGSGGTITGDNIDLTGITAGVYTFQYTVTGTTPCIDATSILTVTVAEAADAGTDNTVDACNSEAAFDLIGSLGGTADAGGAWTDVDGSGGTITGDNIDLTSVMAGTFNFLYTVTGTAPCADASATLTINVVQSANAGTDNVVTACTSETSFDLFGNLLGTPDAGGAWADLDGSGGTITGDNIDLTGITAGVYTFQYTVTGTTPCIDATSILTVTVAEAADAGTDNTVDACNSEAAFDLIGSLGGSADAGGSWTDVDGSGGTITGDNIDLTSVMAGTFNFLYTVTGTAPCTDASATVTINVVQSANAGSDNAVAACTSETSFDLFGNLLGTPDAGGAWADLDGSGGTITGDNIDLTGITAGVYTFQYTVTGTTPCIDATSILTVTVAEAADAGTDNTVDACNSEAAFDLIGSLGGTADAGGSWTDVDGSGGTITGDNIDVTSVMAGTFNFLYTVTGTAPCADASATVTINVVQSANAGTDNAVTACTSETSFDLFGNLLGTPDAGGAWADLDGSGGTITGDNIDLTGITAGVYTFQYTVTGTTPCIDATSILTVTVAEAADAGTDNTVDACNSEAAFDLIGSLGGTADAGGSWTDVDGSGGTITGDNIDLTSVMAGTFNFLYTVTGTAPCADASATLTINVVQSANAGSDNSVTACTTESSLDLFALLGTADLGGFWTDVSGVGGLTGNFLDLNVGAVDGNSYDFIYTVTGIVPCIDASATVTVNATATFDPGTDNSVTVCIADTNFNLFNALGGSPDSGGLWNDDDGIGGLSGDFLDLTASSAVGGGIHTFTYTLSGGSCLPASSIITVEVFEDTANPGLDNAVVACSDESSFSLNSNLLGTPDTGGMWTDLNASGATINIDNISIDLTGVPAGSYNFEYTVAGTAPCLDPSAILTIDVSDPYNASTDESADGCVLDNAFDLGAVLIGEDAGGVWTDDDGAGGLNTTTGIIDLTVGAVVGNVYNFTYTLSGGPCSSESSIVMLTIVGSASIDPLPTVNVCNNESAFDLTTIPLTGSPSGGVFSFEDAGNPITTFDATALAGGSAYPIDVIYTTACGVANATLNLQIRDSATDPFCGVVTGCAAFTITLPPSGRILPNCGQDDGQLTFEISGGVEPYLFSFDVGNGPTDLISNSPIVIPNLGVGTLSYTITDNAGTGFLTCGPLSASLEAATAVQATASEFEDVSCFGEANGSAVINATDFSGTISISVDGAFWESMVPGTRSPKILPANGTYNILVGNSPTDLCPDTVSVTINNLFPKIQLVAAVISEAACNTTDGIIELQTLIGGDNSSGYTFERQGPSEFSFTPFVLAANNQISGLEAGTHIIKVTDSGTCDVEFNINVPGPGVADFNVGYLVEPSCVGGGTTGSIRLEVLSPGSYEVAISTESGAPGPFQTLGAGGVFDFTGITGQTRYYVSVKDLSEDCTTERDIPPFDLGPLSISFEAAILCFDGDQALSLTNIIREIGQPVDVEIVGPDGFSTTFAARTVIADSVLIRSSDGLSMTSGTYEVRLLQNQTVCPGEPISSDFINFDIRNALSATVIEREKSLPDRLTGLLKIGDIIGGLPFYSIRITLDSASVFGQEFMTDWEDVFENPQSSEFEMTYSDIPSGRYLIEIMDDRGCIVVLNPLVPLDTDLFVPNVFTPNGDDFNAAFYIRNLPEVSGNELIITNRWGKVIFEEKNYSNESGVIWDGGDFPDGMYYYKLRTGEGDDLKGYVEIWRGNINK